MEWTKERHEKIKQQFEDGFFAGHSPEEERAAAILWDALAEIDRLNAEASVAKERLGPAGHRILREVLELRHVAEAAGMLSGYLDEQKENYVVSDSHFHLCLNKALKARREEK